MVRIGASFRNFRDRMRSSVNVRAQNVLFFTTLFLVFVLAISIRLTPVLRELILIKAFDPWIQYYSAQYLSEHSLYEYFHWKDYKSWYPSGVSRASLRPGLPFTVVVIHSIMNMVGIPISIYEVCFYFPAFMGGFTVLAAYLLGKEILNRQMGLFAAFFLAFNTGHMQRTMAGFFDNETIGVFATLMTLFFFLKAVRTGKLTHAVIGGVFLGYLSLSWGGYQYVYLLLPIVIGVMILMKKYNENMLIAYAGVQGTGLLIFSLFYGFNPAQLFSSLEIGGIFLFIILLIIFHLIYTKKTTYPKLYDTLIKLIIWALIPAVLIVAIIIWIAPDLIPFGFGKRMQSILSPLMRDELHIVASVAEHMPSAWSIFYYNTLIPLILLPLGVFFCFKRLNTADVLLIGFLLTLFYFTGSMIRIILLFAPAAALMGAYGLVNVLKLYGSFAGEQKTGISRKRKRQLERTVSNSEVFVVYFLVGFICIAQVIHAVDISVNQLSRTQMVIDLGPYQLHDWEEALTWMRNNLDGTDVVVSWWDYGYWLTPIGNVTTVNDNGTFDIKRIGLTGMAFMQTNEIYSAKTLRRLYADYILVYFGGLVSGFGGDEGKWPWMVRICNDNYEVYKKDGMEEDNWEEDSVFDESKYHNTTSGLREANWFKSQICRLMFHEEPTSLQKAQYRSYVQQNFARKISGDGTTTGAQPIEDDNGNTWKSHLELDEEGDVNYNFKVFKKKYFSRNGMVKLYSVDYTALDSSFSIENAQVLDNGDQDYAVFDLKNTGLKNLNITNVKINNEEYDFDMGKGVTDNILKENEENVVWISIKSKGNDFEVNDVVNISVTAEADALDDTKYAFSNSTDSFFVSKADVEAIKINRENSRVIQKSEDQAEFYLEVENIGNSVSKLNHFYIDNTESIYNITEYISGSPIMEPGDKASIYIDNVTEDFYRPGWVLGHVIGVGTFNNITDETLMASNKQNYKLSIADQQRILSPEISAVNDFSILNNNRTINHIPVDLSKNYAYVYENNGSNFVRFNVKNTGGIIFGLQVTYLAKITSVEDNNFYSLSGDYLVDYTPINDTYNLDSNEEVIIEVEDSSLDLEINDEIVIGISAEGYDGNPCARDLGVIHTIRNAPDFQILKTVKDLNSSFILANETGYLTIKNTGNENITLDKITINQTDVFNINYLHGSETLDIQECAIISFDINDTLLAINETNDVFVDVNTTSGLSVNDTFKAITQVFDHDINFDISIDDDTVASLIGNLTIVVDNVGNQDVTTDLIYINNTIIPLVNFSSIRAPIFDIEANIGSISMTIKMSDINLFVTVPFADGDKMKILIRTKEGAEDEKLIDVSGA